MSIYSKIRTAAVTAGSAAILATGAMPKPAAAQSQGTINTILGAAALTAGVILYNNYQHKKQAANAVVGYTRNGGTVYGDGRIVMANGQTVYPNSNGQYPGGNYAYWNNRYNPNSNGNAIDYNRTGQYDSTHRHGYAYNGQYQNGQYQNGQARGNWHDNGNGNEHRDNGWHGHNGHNDH